MPLDDMEYDETPPLGSFQPQLNPTIPYIAPHNIAANPLQVNFEHLQSAVPIAPQSHPVSFLPNPVAPQLNDYATATDSMPSTPVFVQPTPNQQHLYNLSNGFGTPSVQQPQHLLNQSPAADVPSINTLSISPHSNPNYTPLHRAQLRVIGEKSTRPESIQALEKKRVIVGRTKKAAATRKRNRAAQQKQEEAASEMRRSHQNGTAEVRVGTMGGDGFKVGDKVICRPSNSLGQEAAQIVLVTKDQLYVHFEERDRRMDRWISRNEVTPAPQNTHNTDTYSPPNSVKLTRSKSRQLQERNPVSEKEVGNEAVARAEREREEKTKVKNVAKLVFGCYQLDAWYFSPFPIAQPSSQPNSINNTVDCMYMCQYCMIYGKSLSGYAKHKQKCAWIRPPGYRIYHDPSNKIAVYEIDGMVNVGYCQRLTLLGKLFLDHKTLFFDVSPFLFYVVTIGGEVGGFFSKEKPERKSEFNLACLLTLPHHQKKGLGRFLIELSYTLSRCEDKIGSPERPLSDLGQVSYRSFWTYEILKYAREAKMKGAGEVPVDTVAVQTGIRVQDVIQVLKTVKMLKIWKGDQSMNLQNGNNLEKQWRLAKKGKIPVRNCFLIHPNASGYKQSTKKKSGKASGIRNTPNIQLGPAVYHRAGSYTPSLSTIGKKRSRPPKNDRDSLSPSTSRRGTKQKFGTPRTPNALSYGDIPRLNGTRYPNSMRRFHPTSPSTPNSTPATPRPQPLTEPEYSGTVYDGALAQFCNLHTPEKVLLPSNHPDAIPQTTIQVFSRSVNKPLGMVEKNLRDRARRSIVERHLEPKLRSTTPPPPLKRPGAKDVHVVARALNTWPQGEMKMDMLNQHAESVSPPCVNTLPMRNVGSPRKSPLRNRVIGNGSAQDACLATGLSQPSTPRKRVSGIIRKTVDGSPNRAAPAPTAPDIKEEPRSRNSPLQDSGTKKNIEVIDLISDDETPAGIANGNVNYHSIEKVASASSPTTTTAITSATDEFVNGR